MIQLLSTANFTTSLWAILLLDAKVSRRPYPLAVLANLRIARRPIWALRIALGLCLSMQRLRLRSFTSRKRLDFAERCSPINRSPPRIGQLLCVGSAILLPMHICPAMPGVSTWKESSRRTIDTRGRTVSPRSSVRTSMPYGVRYRGRILRCGRCDSPSVGRSLHDVVLL